MEKIFNDITGTIGNTPLVRINRLNSNMETEILVKLESFNPVSCIKERIALAMIEKAEREGKITPNTVIIEPTSGNTGIGLAFICAVKGYRCILAMPETMSVERRQILRIFGAELVLSPGSEGMPGAIRKAEELHASIEDSFVPQQFDNPANPEIHRLTTAEEIWKDTGGKIDVFIAGVGTGGTISGIGEALKKYNPDVKIIAVEPSESPVISGGAAGSHRIQGIGAGFIPKNLNLSVIDEVITVESDNAGKTAREMAKMEGILAGISGGAAMYAALKAAERPEFAGKRIVTIIPDTGERYLSTWLFEEFRN